VADAEWPRFYHGSVETELGPLGHDGHHRHASFEFPSKVGDVSRVFLLCYYEVSSLCEDTEQGKAPDSRWRSASERGDHEIRRAVGLD
jgi:hypothetical protein